MCFLPIIPVLTLFLRSIDGRLWTSSNELKWFSAWCRPYIPFWWDGWPVKIAALLGEHELTDTKALLNIKLRFANASMFGVCTILFKYVPLSNPASSPTSRKNHFKLNFNRIDSHIATYQEGTAHFFASPMHNWTWQSARQFLALTAFDLIYSTEISQNCWRRLKMQYKRKWSASFERHWTFSSLPFTWKIFLRMLWTDAKQNVYSGAAITKDEFTFAKIDLNKFSVYFELFP